MCFIREPFSKNINISIYRLFSIILLWEQPEEYDGEETPDGEDDEDTAWVCHGADVQQEAEQRKNGCNDWG